MTDCAVSVLCLCCDCAVTVLCLIRSPSPYQVRLMATIDDFNSATLATHSWRQYMIHGNSQAIATWAAAQSPQVDPSTLETKDVPNWLGFSDGEDLQVEMRVRSC